MILFILIFLIIVVFVLYASSIIRYFNRDLTKAVQAPVDIPKFYGNLRFHTGDEMVLNIENPDACNTNELKVCRVNDATSCFGCQNLTSTCRHFDRDTIVMEEDGSFNTIAANVMPDEGYCLKIENLTSKCNKYHGDLVLMNLGDNRSALTCTCKNPGYIGNVNLSGACDTAFLCGGKVKDINTELENIECVCNEGYIPKNEKNIPSCIESTVQTYDHYNLLPLNFPIKKKVYDKTISGNFNGEQLTHPCLICPITGLPNNGMLLETNMGSQCVAQSSNRGVPVRRNAEERILLGDEGPDAVLNLQIDEILVFGRLTDQKYISGLIICKYLNNEHFYEKLELAPDQIIGIQMTDHQISFPGNFNQTNVTKSPHIKCVGSFPTYNCELRQSDMQEISHTYMYTKDGHNLRIYTPRSVPGPFIFNNKDWIDSEAMNNLITFDYNDELIKYTPNAKLYGETDAAKKLRGTYLSFKFINDPESPDAGTINATLAIAETDELWQRYRNILLLS